MTDGIESFDVVIIGGGVAGLTVGSELAGKGRSVLILERSQTTGGLARTYRADGFTFDLGPHFTFVEGRPEGVAFLEVLLKDQLYEIPLLIGYYQSGTYFSWPPGLGGVFKYPLGSILYQFIRPLLPPKRDLASYEAEMIALHGQHLYSTFFAPYLKKKLGGLNGQQIHKDWWSRPPRPFSTDAVMRPPKITPLRTLLMLFRKIVLRSKQMLYYPYEGYGQIPAALEKRYRGHGGNLRTGVGPITIQPPENGRVASLSVDGRTIQFKELVSTVPISVLDKLLGLGGIGKLEYSDITFAFVKLRKKARSHKMLYIYFADPESIFSRAYFPSNINPALVPAGKDGLCLELSPTEAEKVGDEQALRARVTKDLTRVGLCDDGDVEEVRFETVRNALPTYSLDYGRELEAFTEKLKRFTNVRTAGRTGAFYNALTDNTIASALETAHEVNKAIGHNS